MIRFNKLNIVVHEPKCMFTNLGSSIEPNLLVEFTLELGKLNLNLGYLILA